MPTATAGAVTTSTIQFTSDGAPIRAFLACPSGVQTAPAIVIIHEWWGLNDHIKDIAQRFAKAGYAALAPDLYSRMGNKVTTDAQEAAKLMESLSSQAALRDLNAAVKFLSQQPGVDPQRIAITGFCMGGTLALTMATHNSTIKASVVFYGKVPPSESFKYLLCPVLFHYGAQDGWVTKQEVERLRQGAADLGRPVEVVIYPAGHAFFNDTRPEAYRQADAQAAWGKTLQFLVNHLR